MDTDKLLAALAGVAAAGGAIYLAQRAQDQGDGESRGRDVARKAVEGDGQGDLACPNCGTTTNRKGEPFTSERAVKAHLRYCREEDGTDE